MNFPPFGVGVPLSAALPVATQFSAAGKLTQSVATANGQVVGVLQGGENGVHYIRPIDANAFAAAAAAAQQQQQQQQQGGNGNNQNTGQHQQQQHQHHQQQQQHHQQQQTQTLITLPITMPGAKPGDPQQHVQIQVVNPVQAQVTQQSTGPGQSPKYHISQIPIQTFGQGATVLTVAYNPNQEGIQIVDGQNGIAEGMTVVAALQPQDIQLIQTEPDKTKDNNNTGVTPVALIKSEITKDDDNNGETTSIATSSSNACTTNTVTIPAQYLQSASSVQEYIQKMQHAQALPVSLQQFLKFNNPEIKREQISDDGVIETINIQQDEHDSLILNDVDNNDNNNSSNNNNNNSNNGGENDENPDDPDGKNNKKKKKYKKKPPKPKKPKPGQVHIATALDGTTLFCCPECHMAYPEKELLEQHLIGHKIERRFICDICGAGLKRKEHLERHKLGHNPERPFVCSVCMKGFKRKEHLNLHFVIHSGEKTEICGECGKGFYRKDHLRKHARSHITRRAKEQAERSQNQIIIKEPTTTTTQVTIQVPTSQMQIPVQIQVPQHHIQVTSNSEEESNQVSTVVLPTASEGIILPQN